MAELGIYVVRDAGPCEVAWCEPDALGFALATLADEHQITREDAVGILDKGTRRWLINPYSRYNATTTERRQGGDAE